MAMQDSDFWRRMGNAAPGLFDVGAGVYGMQGAQKEARQKIEGARGPLYDQALTGAGEALTRAGSMDPKAAAAERFAANQGLLAGKDAADETALMRALHAKGMLGAGVYNPGVEGITPGSAPMQPQLAAFYAARGGRDAKMAADSLDQGEAQIDRMLKRSGMLQDQAAAKQRSGLEAAKLQPSRTAANLNLLKGLGGLFKDVGGVKGVTGLFSGGMDWLNNLNRPTAAYGGGGDFEWFDAW
jgi:hypothetical protein